MSRLFRVVFWERLAVRPSPREFRAVRLTRPWLQARRLVRAFRKASFRVHLRRRIPLHAFLRWPSRQCLTENFTHPISWSGALDSSISWEQRETFACNMLALVR